MISFIFSIIIHTLALIYISFLTNLFVVGLFGEFVVEDKVAFQEFLVTMTIITPIYLSFLWGKK
tara:strand:+ start:305 stop:496 length:192 start_codon:yes stop_codon:yes gene_type:complete